MYLVGLPMYWTIVKFILCNTLTKNSSPFTNIMFAEIDTCLLNFKISLGTPTYSETTGLGCLWTILRFRENVSGPNM